MAARENAEKIYSNLAQLGTKRLIALGFVGLVTFVAIGVAAYLLSRPQQEILYANLERDDVSQIGTALQNAGIPFDVSSDGSVVTVDVGSTAQARMLLAEKGLPRGSGAGYELFDEMGSLGLTSFMQSVTRVRALEGEIARTIQSMRGVKAARVHLVIPEKATFRREDQKPTASVLIRADAGQINGIAQSIRHLVAAAVPSLSPDGVTILDTEGQLLAAGDSESNASSGRKVMLEETMVSRAQSSIRRALLPYLGIGNFEVSVSAQLDTDTQRVSETTFDPESRVERSFRVVRENEQSQNASVETPVTVEQNLPEEDVNAQGGERSSEQNERREELTNYEISSRTVETIFDDYKIDRLSVAVVVDRARLLADSPNGEEVTPEQIQSKLDEIQQIIATAAGLDVQRGDQINVSAVNFLTPQGQLQPIPQQTIMDALMRNMGSLVNALAILVVTLMIIWFGLRPAVAFLLPSQQEMEDEKAASTAIAALPEGQAALAAGGAAPGMIEGAAPEGAFAALADMSQAHEDDDPTMVNRVALRKLERAVDLDDVQAAIILKQWMYNQDRAS
ncbi:flagellar basal-body MS-ring/collar protein FliF [Pseudovibrio exalbescens]|uniref:flagellar basal-body MS-ring/collar protein FliF n=1 Tax=Pseudovibrio exalbescens TaxID=197461 RepID=UPI002365A950|nr:flagellar basal-body MS-ring/collar protein FliF [Pseudovibrio exalbescens]MDD7909009.1 flagellar basal-body MS-ring/collar protein FliF [Pseudovibrio exalbescens]